MFVNVLAILMLVQSQTQPVPKDEIKESLARAESLYYEAKFNDSIQLLMHLTESLQTRPDRLSDKVNANLQLALANIGLNDTEKAKGYLVEMYSLDPNATLDPQQFSPKVISMAAEAKTTMVRIRCQAIGDDAKTSLKQGNAPAIRRLIGSADSNCVDMAAMSTDAADLLYKTGLEAYKSSDFSNALLNFQAALKFSPKHEMATQYVELAQGRLQVAEDRTWMDWQKNFESRNLKDAAVGYRQLVAFNDPKSSQAAKQAGDEYRKMLTNLVATLNQACSAGDVTAVNQIRGQISELLPDPAFGADIRSQMVPCDKPVAKPAVQAEVQPTVRQEAKAEAKPEIKSAALPTPNTQCMQMDYRVAMTRLKTRVDPEIPREARPYLQGSTVTVRAKVHIEDSGTVASVETPSGNPIFNTAVKNAVMQWRFSPAMDATGTRCVDTEIPIVIGPISTSR